MGLLDEDIGTLVIRCVFIFISNFPFVLLNPRIFDSSSTWVSCALWMLEVVAAYTYYGPKGTASGDTKVGYSFFRVLVGAGSFNGETSHPVKVITVYAQSSPLDPHFINTNPESPSPK